MQTQVHAFRTLFEKFVQQEIDRETEILADGRAADFAEYKHKAGRLDGLKRAIALCEDAQTELDKR